MHDADAASCSVQVLQAANDRGQRAHDPPIKWNNTETPKTKGRHQDPSASLHGKPSRTQKKIQRTSSSLSSPSTHSN